MLYHYFYVDMLKDLRGVRVVLQHHGHRFDNLDLKMFLPLVYILNLSLRDFPVHFKATPRFPLQPDLLPEWAAGGATELLLRVQTQEGLQTRWQARTLWFHQRRGGLSLLQVRSPFKGTLCL